MSQNFIFMPFYLAMPKRLCLSSAERSNALTLIITVYTNSILAMLNARGKLRENNIELISIPLTRLEEGDRSSSREPTTDKMNFGSGAVLPVSIYISMQRLLTHEGATVV